MRLEALLLFTVPPEAPAGVITGGWPFVIATYTITGLVLAAYAWSLFSRFNKADNEDVES